MYYIIQENLFREEGYFELLRILEKRGLSHELIKFIPFVHDMEYKTDRNDVWLWGSVNMAKTAAKHNFNPGSMYNDNHDIAVYGPKYGNNMLNSDGVIIRFGDTIPLDNYVFFARPTRDTKIFSGQLFTQDSWKEYVGEVTASDSVLNITDETEIFVAPLKQNIQQEIRCWIIDGKVVTTSRYKLGMRAISQNYDNEATAIEFANRIAAIYCPADCFVLDICLYKDEYKVVEVNCINCSGFYHGNMSKVIDALENKYSNKPS